MQKDVKLKSLFIVAVLSLRTHQEFQSYAADQNHFNKHIIQMLIEHLKDQMI
ncbi:MAG: hypothetical protein P8I82_06290 [Flavobacteriales bacterium]|nr:hypothetical protein [Flavobacteriales bacterium]